MTATCGPSDGVLQLGMAQTTRDPYIDPLTVDDPHTDLTVEQHVTNIDWWIEEVEEDQGISGDEVAWDVMNAYIDSTLGKDTPVGKEVRRRITGGF